MMLRRFSSCRSIPSCGRGILGCPCPVEPRNSWYGALASQRTPEPPEYGDADPVERLCLGAAGILPGYPLFRRVSTPLEDAEMETWNLCAGTLANLRGPERSCSFTPLYFDGEYFGCRHRVSPEFIGSRNCVPMAFTNESPPARGQ